jgi:iron complex outermembrane recepter protein
VRQLRSRAWACVYLSLLSTFVLTLSSVCLAAQQSSTGTVNGTVLDPSGSAVQNAAIVVTDESTGVLSKSATSDLQGHFSVAGLPVGFYTVEVTATGFAPASRNAVQVTADHAPELSVSLVVGSVNQVVTVESNDSSSVAAHLAPMDALLDEHSARTEIKPVFIQNFTNPNADFGELVEMAPGTFSVDPNGIGLGQDKTFFRGFPDGDYDIDFDGVPFYDTNTPTHHTWAFFPSPWVGGVDFDRSPGDASTVGPTPFGGSIHLLSPDMTTSPLFLVGVSYGSFGTVLVDGSFDSGWFADKKSNVLVDVQHMQSSGYETYNYQDRNAGSLKYVYKFSENNVLTGYSGVVWLDSNTPNASPTRGQINTFGDTFLLTDDSNSAELNGSGKCIVAANCLYPLNYRFYTYHVPTDFEYLDWSRGFGHWQTDFKPYTLSYYNAQYYNNPGLNTDGVTFGSVSNSVAAPISATSAVDKLNSYRKYGETFVVSEVSKYGVFRSGLWYEWATTNRYQIPSDPLTRVDTPLPNFHENFNTNSYQPFAEYEFHVTSKLTVTGGFKFSYFNQNLTQFQDNGKTVGCLGGTLVGGKTGTCVGGVPSVNHSAGYNSYMPSADANYRLKSNWSVYGQYGTGTIVPPSGVFDVTGGNAQILPSPTGVYTFQGGTVFKLKQVTLNADVFYTHFQNAFSSITDPNNTSAYAWVSSGDAVSKGFEGEANFYLTRGLSFYVNGTAGKANYVSQEIPNAHNVLTTNINYGKWVADTPSNTEAFGLTYQQKHFDVGIFDKRIGPMWNDNIQTGLQPYNQVIPIAPFSVTNIYFNYVLRNGSHFDQTKLRLSMNNMFDNRNIVGVTQSAAGGSYIPGPLDTLTLLPGRSIAMTITLGYSPTAR